MLTEFCRVPGSKDRDIPGGGVRSLIALGGGEEEGYYLVVY